MKILLECEEIVKDYDRDDDMLLVKFFVDDFSFQIPMSMERGNNFEVGQKYNISFTKKDKK